MRKYYYKDEAGQQQGPVKLDVLKTKNLKPESPVWYDPLPKWTTAGEVDELKSLFVAAAPVAVTAPVEVKEAVQEVKAEPAPVEIKKEPDPVVVEKIAEAEHKEEEKPVQKVETAIIAPVAEAMDLPPETPKEVVAPVVTPVAPAAPAAPVATAAAPVTEKPARVMLKKGPAWVTWVFSLLVLGGAGYFVYQDMEKNKTEATTDMNKDGMDEESNMGKDGDSENTNSNTEESNTDAANTENGNATTTETVTEPATTTAPVTTTTPATTTAPVTKPVAATNTKTPVDPKIAAKKAEEDKKKLATAKKAEEDKAKAAAAARAAKEMNMRNQWPAFITIGKLNYLNSDEDIQAFDVPVTNSTDVVIDKVTIRIDYMKKEKKVLKSETITVSNIPARSTVLGKAPGSKKGNNVHVYITEIRSRGLHFCYPNSSGNTGDPYFCN